MYVVVLLKMVPRFQNYSWNANFSQIFHIRSIAGVWLVSSPLPPSFSSGNYTPSKLSNFAYARFVTSSSTVVLVIQNSTSYTSYSASYRLAMLYLLILRLSAMTNVYSVIRKWYTPYVVVSIGIKETQPRLCSWATHDEYSKAPVWQANPVT